MSILYTYLSRRAPLLRKHGRWSKGDVLRFMYYGRSKY